MYNSYFGFREKPFKLVPNPDFLYLSKNHEIALAHLTYSVNQGDGFVVITGEVGTGKTTLCRIFLERLDQRTECAYIFNPKLDPIELMTSICSEFGIHSNQNTLKELLDLLNDYLILKNEDNRRVVLLIDEAQNLSVENLEMVRLLSNLETTRNKLLQIILVGQPELGDKLDSYELRQLAQRISLSAHLTPLSASEANDYIQHRIHIAAQSQVTLFTKGACRRIHKYAGGIPRMINIACDRALLTAFSLNRPRVTTGLAKMAIQELEARRRVTPRRLPVKTMIWVGTILLLIVLSGAAYQQRARWIGFWIPVQAVSKTVVSENADTYKVPSGSDFKRAPDTPTALAAPAEPALDAVPIPVAANPTAANSPAEASSEAALAPITSPADASLTAADASAVVATPATAASPGNELSTIIDALEPLASRLNAVKFVLGTWQQPPPSAAQFPLGINDAAFFEIAARQYGLRECTIHSDMALVKELNLPAIVGLKQKTPGRIVYAAMLGWQNGLIHLATADGRRTIQVDLETLLPYLQGTVYVFWKNILVSDSIIAAGAPPQAILAIKNLLRQIGYQRLNPEPSFDAETQNAILDFQSRHRLTPDGLAGPLTKILLIKEAKAFNGPRLSGNDGGTGA